MNDRQDAGDSAPRHDPHSSDSRRDGRHTAWVFDTNVVLDWLVFHDATAVRLARHIEGGRVRLVTRADCRAELEHVLGYAALPVDDTVRLQVLATFDRWTRDTPSAPCPDDVSFELAHDRSAPGAGSGRAVPCDALPVCRDPSDQKFLEVAAQGGAAWLVTKDKRLLEVSRRLVKACGCEVVTPARALARLAIIGATEP